MISVVCAIINFNDKILAVERSEKMSLPLKWEFPGGKIEHNVPMLSNYSLQNVNKKQNITNNTNKSFITCGVETKMK